MCTSERLGEREILWEHKQQAIVSTAFLRPPKLSLAFLQLQRNTENMFSISFRKHHVEKKENNLLTLIIQMYILFAHAIVMSTAHANSVSPSSKGRHT